MQSNSKYYVVYQSYDKEAKVSCMSITSQGSTSGSTSLTKTLEVEYWKTEDSIW